MNYRERMKEYLKEPDEYSSQWGKWGILNKEQRDLIKRLLKEMDGADEVIKNQFFEIERLKRQIKIKDEWCDRIWEIGTDYDGYGNDLEGLRKLVDELIEYSNKAKKCDDKCVAYISYENGEKIKENILMEKLGSDKE